MCLHQGCLVQVPTRFEILSNSQVTSTQIETFATFKKKHVHKNHMKKSFVFLICASLLLVACTSEELITSYDECVGAGYPIMESYPERCSDGENTFVNTISVEPPTACTMEYEPVCGEVEIQCITTPCDPLQTTFSNTCEAESANAQILYEGACQDPEPNPQGACVSFDGNWLEDSQECEGMAQSQCQELGGNYNECASACRNSPKAQLCTTQCVQVCQFK